MLAVVTVIVQQPVQYFVLREELYMPAVGCCFSVYSEKQQVFQSNLTSTGVTKLGTDNNIMESLFRYLEYLEIIREKLAVLRY